MRQGHYTLQKTTEDHFALFIKVFPSCLASSALSGLSQQWLNCLLKIPSRERCRTQLDRYWTSPLVVFAKVERTQLDLSYLWDDIRAGTQAKFCHFLNLAIYRCA